MLEDLGKARIAAHSIEQFYDFHSKEDYGRIIKELKGEIVALLNDQHTLVENYKKVHVIYTKMKSSLIPIIGKSLSYLFGTDFNTLHSSVSRLAKSQKEIAHVVDENISVINITRVEMSENRQALNKIIRSLANFDVKLCNITQALEKQVFQVGQFLQLYLQLDSITQAIRRIVWQANPFMEHVQLQLNVLSLGHLSQSVITQRSLKGLLVQIENHLPQYLKLPYDPNGVVWKLYQTLICTTVLDKGRFLGTVSIPLLDNTNTFEIFNILNMPIPVKGPVVPTDRLLSMTAWYRLETPSIAVNLAQLKNVLLTAIELEHCTSPLWHYCDGRSPVYSMSSSELCTVVLFMKDTENVKNYCKTEGLK